MSKLTVFVLLVFLTFGVAALPINTTNVYAQPPMILLNGTITKNGCDAIGGTIFTTPVDFLNQVFMDVCNFEGKFLGISDPVTDCNASGDNKWIDPDTGKSYPLPTNCDAPVFCDNPDYSLLFYHSTPTRVRVENRNFTVTTGYERPLCHTVQFDQQNEQLKLKVNSANGDPANVDIVIPRELLGGNFTVLVNGGEIKTITIQRTEDSAKLTVPVTFPTSGGQSEIVITGTEVVPEFPVGIIMFLVGVLIIVPLVYVKRFRSYKPFG